MQENGLSRHPVSRLTCPSRARNNKSEKPLLSLPCEAGNQCAVLLQPPLTEREEYMKKQVIWGVTLTGLMLMTGMSTYAQSQREVDANIPFTFHVENNVLPAGKYALRPLDFLAEPDTILLRSDDDTAVIDFMTTQTSASQMPQETKLVFNKYGDQYFLSQIWVAGHRTGREVPKSGEERQMEKMALKSEKAEVACQPVSQVMQPSAAAPSHDMSTHQMRWESHHVLALAYRADLATFAKSLREEIKRTKTVDPVLANSMLVEMQRSFFRMAWQHELHLQALSPALRAKMSAELQQINQRGAQIVKELRGLKTDLQAGTPAAESVVLRLDDLIAQLDHLPKMMRAGV